MKKVLKKFSESSLYILFVGCLCLFALYLSLSRNKAEVQDVANSDFLGTFYGGGFSTGITAEFLRYNGVDVDNPAFTFENGTLKSYDITAEEVANVRWKGCTYGCTVSDIESKYGDCDIPSLGDGCADLFYAQDNYLLRFRFKQNEEEELVLTEVVCERMDTTTASVVNDDSESIVEDDWEQ